MSGTANSIYIPGYPASNRVPGVFAAINAANANTATVPQRSLILAQTLSTGTAPPGVAVLSAGIGEAQTSYGVGSMAAIAVERYRGLDPVGELWMLPLADATGADPATGGIGFTGTATANAVLPLYIDANYVPVSVSNGDTAAAIATNTAAAIAAYATPGGNPLPYTAAASGGAVTLTARNAGPIANTGTIMLSVLGTAAGQGHFGTTNVPGVTASITPMSGGTTGPTIANALAGLPVQPYDFICCPYADATSLSALQGYLGDQAGTWNWSVQLFGGAFTAYGGTVGARTTWSALRNDQHTSAIGAQGSPSPDWHWAVDYTAAAAVSLRNDPTIPLGGLTQGVVLNVMAPPPMYRDTFAIDEVLLNTGMSTYRVDNSGVVSVQRAITTYQFNAAGQPDNSYLNVNVPFQLMTYIRTVETMLGANFNQSKLVADGSRIPPGSNMVTSQTILYSVVAQYTALATVGIPGVPAGLVQNPQAFASNAVAQNAGGGVVKMLLPVQLGGQLIAIAMSIAFTQP